MEVILTGLIICNCCQCPASSRSWWCQLKKLRIRGMPKIICMSQVRVKEELGKRKRNFLNTSSWRLISWANLWFSFLGLILLQLTKLGKTLPYPSKQIGTFICQWFLSFQVWAVCNIGGLAFSFSYLFCYFTSKLHLLSFFLFGFTFNYCITICFGQDAINLTESVHSVKYIT